MERPKYFNILQAPTDNDAIWVVNIATIVIVGTITALHIAKQM